MGIPVSFTPSVDWGYMWMASLGSQRSSSSSFLTTKVGFQWEAPLALAPPPTGAPVGGADCTDDTDFVSPSPSVSVSVRGRGGGFPEPH